MHVVYCVHSHPSIVEVDKFDERVTRFCGKNNPDRLEIQGLDKKDDGGYQRWQNHVREGGKRVMNTVALSGRPSPMSLGGVLVDVSFGPLEVDVPQERNPYLMDPLDITWTEGNPYSIAYLVVNVTKAIDSGGRTIVFWHSKPCWIDGFHHVCIHIHIRFMYVCVCGGSYMVFLLTRTFWFEWYKVRRCDLLFSLFLVGHVYVSGIWLGTNLRISIMKTMS